MHDFKLHSDAITAQPVCRIKPPSSTPEAYSLRLREHLLVGGETFLRGFIRRELRSFLLNQVELGPALLLSGCEDIFPVRLALTELNAL